MLNYNQSATGSFYHQPDPSAFDDVLADDEELFTTRTANTWCSRPVNALC
jgi:hypothetical protein